VILKPLRVNLIAISSLPKDTCDMHRNGLHCKPTAVPAAIVSPLMIPAAERQQHQSNRGKIMHARNNDDVFWR
jgi:hypothetical protein